MLAGHAESMSCVVRDVALFGALQIRRDAIAVALGQHGGEHGGGKARALSFRIGSDHREVPVRWAGRMRALHADQPSRDHRTAYKHPGVGKYARLEDRPGQLNVFTGVVFHSPGPAHREALSSSSVVHTSPRVHQLRAVARRESARARMVGTCPMGHDQLRHRIVEERPGESRAASCGRPPQSPGGRRSYLDL